MRDMWTKLARRGAAGIVMGVTVAALAGGSYVVASRGADTAPGLGKAAEEGAEVTGGHGGNVERFHGDGETPCDAPDGVTLEGNWTHGDYVSAWAKSGDRDAHKAAAKSACGKPQAAVDARARVHGKSADAPGKDRGGAGAESSGKSGKSRGKSGDARGKAGAAHGLDTAAAARGGSEG